MSGGLQDIKKRIKSVKNIKQVTKAMEAVSASKMRKSVAAALTSKNYSNLGWQLINNLAKVTDENKHPLLKKKNKINNLLLIFLTSDKGLCGGFNSQIIRQMEQFLKINNDKNIDVIAIGKKGQRVLKKINKNIIGAYQNMSNEVSPNMLRPIAKTALDGFMQGKYDQVNIVFTDFKSAMNQVPIVRQLLPLQKDFQNLVGDAKNEKTTNETDDVLEYIFEPNTEELLDFILPRLLEIQIYQAVLESNASEHSARMLAMKNATDSAIDMIHDLTLTYNQARQASITQEIAEISAGRAAQEEN
ncbi:MAG: ATP synthase F1 subunit gamma [Patescibacteria group bacterium]